VKRVKLVLTVHQEPTERPELKVNSTVGHESKCELEI
jgi:hypothetical protein